MHDLILQILPVIEKIAVHTTSDRDQQHDIKQDLILKCYDNEEKVRKAVKEKWIKNFLYRCAMNLKIDDVRQPTKVSLCFDIKEEEDIEHKYPQIGTKGVEELLHKLDGLDRVYVQAYIDCNFNIAKTARETTVSRSKLYKELNRIFEIWKQQDIFLQQ